MLFYLFQTQYEFLYQAVLSHLVKLDDMYENLQS